MFIAFDGTEFDNILDGKSYENKTKKDLYFYNGSTLIPLNNVIWSINYIDKIVIKTKEGLNSLNKILNILDDDEYYEMFKMLYTTGTYKYNAINESYFKSIREEDVMSILSEDILGRNFIFHDTDGYWWYKI